MQLLNIQSVRVSDVTVKELFRKAALLPFLVGVTDGDMDLISMVLFSHQKK